MRRRKPQPVCKCGHAKSQHRKINHNSYLGISAKYHCVFCWEKCLNYQQDNLKTLEKLSEFVEQKSIKNVSL